MLSIYAIGAIIAAILNLQLPETKGKEIPDTIEETENLKKSSVEIKQGIIWQSYSFKNFTYY